MIIIVGIFKHLCQSLRNFLPIHFWCWFLYCWIITTWRLQIYIISFLSYKFSTQYPDIIAQNAIRFMIFIYIDLSCSIFCRSVIDSLQKCQLMWKFPTANYSQSMFCISSMCQVYVAPLINLWRLQILFDSMFA